MSRFAESVFLLVQDCYCSVEQLREKLSFDNMIEVVLMSSLFTHYELSCTGHSRILVTGLQMSLNVSFLAG